MSYREGLKAERKNVKLRIRALLREERVREPGVSPWTRAWREWLVTALPGEQSQWVMQRLLEQLARLETDLAAAEARMAEATADDADTQRLLAQPGIGLVTAVMLRAQIGRFNRFRSGKQLSRFCGVTPTPPVPGATTRVGAGTGAIAAPRVTPGTWCTNASSAAGAIRPCGKVRRCVSAQPPPTSQNR